MPFREGLKEAYDKAIKPACEQAGFNALRVDELSGHFNINQKIVEYIFGSEAIIADLTGWNPNVFYELGIAHAVGNKTIMIVQSKERPPFDITSYRCIAYEQTQVGLKKLCDEIAASLVSLEKWREYPTNPVQHFKPSEKKRPVDGVINQSAPSIRIFLSHASEDKALARRLEDELTAAGIEVWVDHAFIGGGDNLPKRISEALRWCNTFLLLWSSHAASSSWVEEEWKCAKNLHKLIIPCKIDEISVPDFLANTVSVDFTDPDQGINDLLRALRRTPQTSDTWKMRGVGKIIFSRLPDMSPPTIPKPSQNE